MREDLLDDQVERARGLAAQPLQIGFRDDLRTPIRQADKGVAHALQLGMRVPEDARVVQRGDRQLVSLVRPHGKIAVGAVEFKGEVSRLKLAAVLFAEKRNQQFAAQIGMVRVPIDVEPACIFGFLAPFEHVEPQGVVGSADADVVGDEVEDVAQAVVGEGRHHSVEIGLVAEFGVQRPMVDNVIAVGAARPRLHIRRGIDMANPQPCEIRGEPRRIRKTKPLVKLEPVGDARNHLLLRAIRRGKRGTDSTAPRIPRVATRF